MIKISPELKALIPPLAAEEYQQLEQNIINEGCRDPLVIWNGVLVDGHNRFEICQKNGINYSTTELQFDSIEQVRIWMRNNQMGRRNLTPAWRIDLQLANKEDLAKIGATKRVESKIGNTNASKTTLSQNDNDETPEPKHDTRKEIAKAAGTSSGMVGMAEQVRKKAPEMWEKAKQGEVSITTAYNEIKAKEKKEKRQAEIQEQRRQLEESPLQTPPDDFDVVVIDPPWPYGREYDPEGSRVANPYPEMSIAEIEAIQIPAKSDSVMFLWTTHQFLLDAFYLLEQWGFEYKACMVWDKEKIGMGHWVRMQCEFCLVGIKGKPFWDNTTWRDIMREPRREHSRKPEVFYQMVQEITAGNRIDYFSRQRRDGWFSYGNDVEKF